MRSNSVIQLLSFFILACGFTFLASFLPSINFYGVDVRTIICCMGPLLAGLFCYSVFKTENTYQISLTGVKPILIFPVFSLAILLPILLYKGLDRSAIIAVVINQLVIAFCEEFGWRHYLLNVTANCNRWLQAFIIGSIWVFWHFSYAVQPVEAILGKDLPILTGLLIAIPLLSVLAVLWGDLVMKTRSLLVPITAHSLLKFGDPITIGIVVVLLHSIQIFWYKLKPKKSDEMTLAS